MTQQESARLARLEQRVEDLANRLDDNSKDTKAILSRLDNLSGGKQALMWITGIVISLGAVVAAFIEAMKGLRVH